MKVTLKNIIPQKYVVKEGDLGLEFEVEAKNALPLIQGTWKTENDPSLRMPVAYEYVTRNPLPRKGIDRAVRKLLGKIKEPAYDPVPNSRNTSWHVHVNTMDFSPIEMIRSLYTYWLLEPLLINVCGDHRKNNTFALQLSHASFMAKSLDEEFYTGLIRYPYDAMYKGAFEDGQRYGAQNLAAFRKFGTVEYRSMEGTLDEEKVLLWVGILEDIWWNNPFKDPDHLLSTYYEKGTAGVTALLFKDNKFYYDNVEKKYLDKKVEDTIEDNCMVLVEQAEECPYTWDKWNSLLVKKYLTEPAKRAKEKALPLFNEPVANGELLRAFQRVDINNIPQWAMAEPVPAARAEQANPDNFFNVGR